jgi:hypothetical protein
VWSKKYFDQSKAQNKQRNSNTKSPNADKINANKARDEPRRVAFVSLFFLFFFILFAQT